MEAIIGLIGWLSSAFFYYKYIQQKKQSHCPRCNRVWKRSDNIADDTYMCKCGMTTYDRHKYSGTFEEKSKNY